MNKQVTMSLFDEQVVFGSLHPEFKDFIPTIMGVHSTCQVDHLGTRVPGPLEAYEHIFEGRGATKAVKCKWCANELSSRMEQRKRYL
jgi:hypothetical protein